MTKADKTEIKEMLADHISVYVIRQEGNYEMINFKLDKIQEQTTKTNGRVNRLEDEVRDLEDENLRSSSIKKWMYRSVSAASILVGIFWVIFQFIYKT